MENEEYYKMKIVALKEGYTAKFTTMLNDYEDRVSDLRIELTVSVNERDQKIQSLEAELAAAREAYAVVESQTSEVPESVSQED